jgi:3-carboxy-cis,cis-muconate cycloisomerase
VTTVDSVGIGDDHRTGRLEADLDVGLLAPARAGTVVESLTGDRAWLQAMLDAEAALSRAQARLGLVPAGAAAAVTTAARAERFDLVALARAARGAANPVVVVVQALTTAVAATDPAAADYVHRGSTSQDILDSAAMLVAARSLRAVLADLGRTADALARLAVRHRDTPMAGRTLTQHAVPITFGLKAAGWLHAVAQAEQRVRRTARELPVQLGGAAGTLAGYVEYARDPGRDLDRYADELVAAFADELGLAEPVLPWHTVRTPILDLASTLTQVTGGVGKFAVDVASLSRTEVGEVVEPAAAGRGVSSAMPHKRNPVLATLILSAAAQVPPLAATLALSMLAEDERPAGAWHAEWQPLRDCLRLAGGAAETAAELAEGLTAYPERMRTNLDLTGSLIVSERLAVALTPVLGKVEAKRVVSAASATAARSGRSLAEELADAPGLTGRLRPGQLADLLDPAQYLGVAAHLVDRAVRHHRPS